MCLSQARTCIFPMSYNMLFFFVDIVSLLTVTVVNFLFSQMSLLFKDYYYVYLFCVQYMYMYIFIIPPLPEGGGGYTVLPLSVCPSFRPSKIFFVAFFSVTVDGRNLVFGHKLHIGTPYRGKRFWTRQIPTSCLPTLLIFIQIEHICSFFVAFFSATIDGRNLIFGHKHHIGIPYCG